MSDLSSFSTARTSAAHALMSNASRHLPVSLYVISIGVSGPGIAIAARTWSAPRRDVTGATVLTDVTEAARRRSACAGRAPASARGAAMVMAAMSTTVRGKVGATTRVRRSCGAGSGAAPQEFHPSVRARAGDRTPLDGL